MIRFLALAATFLAAPTAAATPDQLLAEWSRPVDAAPMKATVEKLVSFGTRHTLSSQTDPKRGIGAALNWTEGQFRGLGLMIARPCDVVTAKRLPKPTRICDIVAIQRGTERPNDVVIITGHIDSRVSDVMNATADAPGANDDGSGTAAVLEAARVLSRREFPGTIVYAALSGEEQGLFGGKVLADYAKAQGWNVIANLNNDIIGNSCGSDGVCDVKTVRVFSEGPRWQGHEALAEQQRSLGGENDSPSRNLSRFLDGLAERIPAIGLDVMQVWRSDRFGRGGDHLAFLDAGFPAIRLSVAVENYDAQHQDLRTDKGVRYGDTVDRMDFNYLAKVTRLNVAALAAIASAPPPPTSNVEGAVANDTTLNFSTQPAFADVRVYQRRTDESRWHLVRGAQPACIIMPVKKVAGRPASGGCQIVFPHVRVDNWVFGVSSVSKDGFESPVASAVPGGGFGPVEPRER